jgi:hypothetical protein
VGRRLIGGVLAVAVLAIGVFAGIDALRSSGRDATEAGSTATEGLTSQAASMPNLESSTELRIGHRPVRLIPGLITTDGSWATFSVPPGWYGSEGLFGVVLGKRLLLEGQAVDWASGGILVQSLDMPLAAAADALKQVKGGFRVRSMRFNGKPAREYVMKPNVSVSLSETLGQTIGGDIDAGDPNLILVALGETTLVIRRAYFSSDPDKQEVDAVLSSFRFAAS